MAIYDAHSYTDEGDRRRDVTLRRNTFAGGSLRFSSKHRPCKPERGAVKVWTGKSGIRPVIIRRNGKVIAQVFKG